MTLEFEYDHHDQEPDDEPLQGKELYEALALKIISSLRAQGFEEADLERFGDKVGLGQFFDVVDFTLPLASFIEKNIGPAEWMELALEEFDEEYPITKQLRRRLRGISKSLSKQEIDELTNLTINGWLRDRSENKLFRQLRQEAGEKTYKFANLLFSYLRTVDMDDGYEEIEGTGILPPSTIYIRTSFSEIFSQLVEGVEIDGNKYLAFFVPEDTDIGDRFSMFCEDDYEEQSDNAEFHEESLTDDEELELLKLELQDTGVSVSEPENYFVILDSKITKEMMKVLLTDEEYLPLIRCILAYHVIRHQHAYIDALMDFMEGVTFLKKSEILDSFDKANERLHQIFWKRLESYLNKNEEVVVQLLPRRLQNEVELAQFVPTEFVFSKSGVDILVTVKQDTQTVGTCTLSKKIDEDSDVSWVFSDGKTLVGYDQNDEIDANVLTEAELALNDLVNQINITTPETLVSYKLRLNNLEVMMKNFQESRNFPALLEAINESYLLQSVFQVNPRRGLRSSVNDILPLRGNPSNN